MENKVSHTNSKGAEIFKKMLADKKFISAFLKKGGKLSDLKDKYKFLDILSLQSNR
ncbi:MAG: hypothetical protein RL708_845 [Bacteroidota bacterium]|jgi:hypothetical protein